ncbi:MAG: hypothetical protein ABI112_02930 [Terracoccus sp.]
MGQHQATPSSNQWIALVIAWILFIQVPVRGGRRFQKPPEAARAGLRRPAVRSARLDHIPTASRRLSTNIGAHGASCLTGGDWVLQKINFI